MNIDGELEDTDGIKESNTNYAKSQAEVELDPEKVSDEAITEIIKKIGYQANPIS